MSGETKSAAELAAETKAAFDKQFDKLKEIAEDAVGKAEAGEKLSQTAKDDADEALTGMNDVKAKLEELEQKLDRGGDDGADQQKSVGAQFVECDEFKTFQDNPRKGDSASLEVKADLTTTTGGAGGLGAAVHSTHLPGIQPLPQRRMTIRGLLMPGQTDSSLIDYDRETGFANNADMVAEGGLKPQSDFSIEEVQTRTKVIAHWMRTSKQTLSDVAQIRSIIDNRLLYGLAFKEELQLLFGDGTGENLNGIVPQATAYAAPAGFPAGTSIDQIRYMALQAVLAEYPATGIVLHPTDWAFIETLKDSEGRYIIGNPQGSLAPTLWGLPVVATPAMIVDKVLVGAFDMGAQIFDQWASRIETGFQNDDFTRNKVTILAEERLALAVYRPETFIYGDFDRVA
ncbi:phage major capsid protein [Tropicibacter sp. R16_0]|uniref:phage major capsid protein n=1 Tax=Tropicibacter sp. R16_0 TaxID=2821102 RepID=UPI001ADD2050|nr:phage major capsid protein [Tropicibacter sp. R16_0]MBO9453258.1 phage major capsid protein [Tropicibacter sp. R16_0]